MGGRCPDTRGLLGGGVESRCCWPAALALPLGLFGTLRLPPRSPRGLLGRGSPPRDEEPPSFGEEWECVR